MSVYLLTYLLTTEIQWYLFQAPSMGSEPHFWNPGTRCRITSAFCYMMSYDIINTDTALAKIHYVNKVGIRMLCIKITKKN